MRSLQLDAWSDPTRRSGCKGKYPARENQGLSSTPQSVARRILLVAPEPLFEDRGTPIALKYVLEALTECGHEVDLLTYPLGKSITFPGVHTFRIPNLFRIRHVPIGFSIQKLLLNVILFPAIWRRMSQETYCCVHAVEEAAFPVVLARRWFNVPVIYDMQSSLPEQMKKHGIFRPASVQKVLRWFERWLIRNADFVVCSAGLEEYVREVHPSVRVREWYFPSQPVEVSAKEVEQLRDELEIAPGGHVVLYTGTFEPYQGLTRLLDAASEVVDQIPSTKFVLVGATRFDNLSFGKEATRLQQLGALKLLDRQPRTTMPRFLAMADVVVSLRVINSNLPLKIFDYMAAGRPIVAIDSPMHRKVLDNTRAVLVGPTVRELSEEIVRLLENRQEAERLGAAAKAYAEQHLGWESFVEMVSQLHDGTLGRGDVRPSTSKVPYKTD